MTREEREAAVDWFAMRAKLKLREPRNEAKGGWRADPPATLRWRLNEELEELNREMLGGGDYDAIISECCDVSAFAMMIADRVRMLRDE